jgi:hypothetical protein
VYARKDRWTAEQTLYVKKYAGVLKDDEIAAVLGRTAKSVRLKRQRMGVAKESGHGVCKLKNPKNSHPPEPPKNQES